ncbi:hypothetical protein GBA52_014470 [Prunus armeniaca]|nr:hypothetical protein GBA52_014470 [Prunus armeniaca]
MEGKGTVTNADERETLTMEHTVNVEKPIKRVTGMEVMNVEERETPSTKAAKTDQDNQDDQEDQAPLRPKQRTR